MGAGAGERGAKVREEIERRGGRRVSGFCGTESTCAERFQPAGEGETLTVSLATIFPWAAACMTISKRARSVSGGQRPRYQRRRCGYREATWGWMGLKCTAEERRRRFQLREGGERNGHGQGGGGLLEEGGVRAELVLELCAELPPNPLRRAPVHHPCQGINWLPVDHEVEPLKFCGPTAQAASARRRGGRWGGGGR